MFTTLNWHIVFAIFSSCFNRQHLQKQPRSRSSATSWDLLERSKIISFSFEKEATSKAAVWWPWWPWCWCCPCQITNHHKKNPLGVLHSIPISVLWSQCPESMRFHQLKDKNAESPEDQTVQSWEHMACRDWPEGSQFNGDEDLGCDLCFPSTSFPNISLH